MIPGMPAGMMDGNEEDTTLKLKRMIYITDAMRQDELESDGMIFVSYQLPFAKSTLIADPGAVCI